MHLSQSDSTQHRELRDSISTALGSWRRFLIAVDGVDGAGKSTLARYLSWQIGAPLIETDLFLEGPEPTYRTGDLRAVIEARLLADRPAMIEGIFILQTLKTLGFKEDFVVRVIDANRAESARRWQRQWTTYLHEYPDEDMDFIFNRSNAE